MMIIFDHPYYYEMAIRRGLIRMGGRTLTLQRHEETSFRFIYHNKFLVEIAAINFPHEHQNAEGICIAFDVIGNVYCVDRACLRGDFSSVCLLLMVDSGTEIPARLLVRNKAGDGLTGIAELRVTGAWEHTPGTPPPVEHEFPNSAPPPLRDSDPDNDDSSPDATRSPRPVVGAVVSSGTLPGHVVARREATPPGGVLKRCFHVPRARHPAVPLHPPLVLRHGGPHCGLPARWHC